jgi:hypothetical protein
LNVYAPTEDKTDDKNGSFYDELLCMFDKFPKYHMKVLLRDFVTKVCDRDVFKLIIENENLLEISNDSKVKVLNLTISKSLGQNMTFLYCNVDKFIWTSPYGKTHGEIDYILRQEMTFKCTWRLIFEETDFDTDRYIVVAKFRERLALNEQHTDFVWRELTSRN